MVARIRSGSSEQRGSPEDELLALERARQVELSPGPGHLHEAQLAVKLLKLRVRRAHCRVDAVRSWEHGDHIITILLD